MILKYWVRVLSFDLFPPEISSVIVYRFTYHARMDRIHRFPFFIEEESHYAPIKLSVVGSTIAGKTCMVKRFCKNKFYTFQERTFGGEFNKKFISLNGYKARLDIWDVSSLSRKCALFPKYIQGAVLVIFVFAITYRESLMDIKKLFSPLVEANLKYILNENLHPFKILVGNHCDRAQNRQCSKEDIERIARECGMDFVMECSGQMANANSGQNKHAQSMSMLYISLGSV